MTDQTKNRLLLLAGIVVAVLILGFAGAFLYLLIIGRASVPEPIVTALSSAIVGLIAVGAIFINGQLSRQHSDTNAAQTQATVVQAAQDTQAHVQDVAARVEQVHADVITAATVPAVLVATDTTPEGAP